MYPNALSHTQGKALGLWLLALAALVGGVLTANLLFRPPTPPELSGTTRLEPPRALHAFELTDHQGHAFTLERLRGRWTYLFFGYTHCPDVCPTTMLSLNQVAGRIAARPATLPAPQYVFVSIDPERDTPAQLARFVPYFNPAFLGVTGQPASIEDLANQVSVAYMKVETERADGYLMDHTAAILLVDPQGRLHALISPPFEPEALAEDFEKLHRYYEASQ